jgi:hypothetical protein
MGTESIGVVAGDSALAGSGFDESSFVREVVTEK